MAEPGRACYIYGMMPYDPASQEMRRRRFRPIPVRMLVPNVITLLAICAGLTAIRGSRNSGPNWTVWPTSSISAWRPG